MRQAGTSGTRLHGLVLRICTVWAVLGGLLLVAVVLMNVFSIVSFALFNASFTGDFEMTEVGVAVAVFAFLPYCQIAGLNVTADIFTARASRFWLSLFSLLGAAIALGFGAFMLWRMYFGMIDQITFEATTAILQIPLWWGFAAALASLALLVLASFASLVDALHGMARG
jgi:TRAP-type C4-dicarboxylate transport system permease small subunit